MVHKVHVLTVGFCTHPACMAVKGAGLANRCFPARAYLIDTPQGYWLMDTGYAERMYVALQQGWNRLYGWVTPVTWTPEQSLHRQLVALGVSPQEIQNVLLSHFHADHIAGLLDFPSSRIWCSESGWLDVRHRQGFSAIQRAFIPRLLPNDFNSRCQFVEQAAVRLLPSELAPFIHGWDLLGDQTLFAVDLPGHAVGHIGLLVQEAEGWTLLAGDAAWSQTSIVKNIGPSLLSFLVQDSYGAYYQTLSKLHHLANQSSVRILLTHEEA